MSHPSSGNFTLNHRNIQHIVTGARPTLRITVNDLMSNVSTPVNQVPIPVGYMPILVPVYHVPIAANQGAALTSWPLQPKPPPRSSRIVEVWPATSNLDPRQHLVQGQVVLPHAGVGSQAWMSARSRARPDSIAGHIVYILQHCGEIHIRCIVEAMSKFWLKKHNEFAAVILLPGNTQYAQVWDVLEKTCRQTLSKAAYANLFEKVPRGHGTWRLSTKLA